jgi:phage terminase small subunit
VKRNGLTLREQRFVLARLAHRDVMGAAKAAGISTRTARRYADRPHVREAMRSAMRDALHDAVGELARGVVAAAQLLTDTVAGNVTPSATRVASARAVLQATNALLDQADLEATLERLEAAKRADELARRNGGLQ